VFCLAGHQSHHLRNLCADGVDADIVQSVSDMMANDECSALFEQVSSFQKNSVKHWNPHINKATLGIVMQVSSQWME